MKNKPLQPLCNWDYLQLFNVILFYIKFYGYYYYDKLHESWNVKLIFYVKVI